VRKQGPAESEALPAGDLRTICYSVQPNAFLSEHAENVARVYDGFFFTVGSWDEGTIRLIGVERGPTDRSWLQVAGENIAALRAAGASENLLTVHFGESGEWPSSQTLLSNVYTDKMCRHFAAIGRVAKELGFRGVCIDVEYPFPRYDVSNRIYTYKGYSVGNLVEAAREQGRSTASAVLHEFPGAVVFTLPGVLRCRPIARNYLLGFLGEMARRDAPGGFHLGTEFTYSLNDPVTNLATPRFEDCAIQSLASKDTVSYWRRCCTIAPGVWPLHMVETGGEGYPVRPWKEEVSELRQQMAILRRVAKRYIWSFSSAPIWYVHSARLERKYGLKKPDLKRHDMDVRQWHGILADKPALKSPHLERLAGLVEGFDRGELSPEELCDAFGTPGRWWVLGMLGNPRTSPEYAAEEAVSRPVDPHTPYHGRNGAVRWFAFDNMDPRGLVSCVHLFDWRNTDDASAYFSSFIRSPEPKRAYLNVGWDDGLLVRLGDRVVFQKVSYPPEGHGFLYHDRYCFERKVPIRIPEGRTRLTVTSLNSHGNWLFSLRITDREGIPLQGLRFRLR